MIFTFFVITFLALSFLAISLFLKIKSFTMKDETYFFGIYMKKSLDKKSRAKIRTKLIQDFANSSHRNKVLCLIELIIIIICNGGGIVLFLINLFFHLDRVWLVICIGVLITFFPFAILLQSQLYSFWKSQPIWKEQPVDKQQFLLPNQMDYKRIQRYWLQLTFILYILAFLVFYLLLR